MRGVIVMLIVVVSGVMVGVVASGVVSAVTFSCGASCLCRGQRVMDARLWKPYVVCLKPRIAAHCLKNFRLKRMMILRQIPRNLSLLWHQRNFRQQNARWHFRAELMRQTRWQKPRRVWLMHQIRRLSLKLTRLIFHHCLRQPRRLLRLTLNPNLNLTLNPTSLVQPLSFLNRLLPRLHLKPFVKTGGPPRRLWCSPRCDNQFHKIRCP